MLFLSTQQEFLTIGERVSAFPHPWLWAKGKDRLQTEVEIVTVNKIVRKIQGRTTRENKVRRKREGKAAVKSGSDKDNLRETATERWRERGIEHIQVNGSAKKVKLK